MGAGASSTANSSEFKSARYRWAPLLSVLSLTEGETRVLFDIFQKIDTDRSGQLSYDEFVDFVDTKSSPFLRRVMTVFDEDSDGSMDFGEFVAAVWNFNTLDSASINMFAFELYDNDQSGELSKQELRQVIEDMFQDEKGQGRIDGIDRVVAALQKLLREMHAEEQEFISRERFELFLLEYPAAAGPIIDLQLDMQIGLGGAQFWRGMQSRRNTMGKKGGIYELRVTISEVRSRILGLEKGRQKELAEGARSMQKALGLQDEEEQARQDKKKQKEARAVLSVAARDRNKAEEALRSLQAAAGGLSDPSGEWGGKGGGGGAGLAGMSGPRRTRDPAQLLPLGLCGPDDSDASFSESEGELDQEVREAEGEGEGPPGGGGGGFGDLLEGGLGAMEKGMGLGPPGVLGEGSRSSGSAGAGAGASRGSSVGRRVAWADDGGGAAAAADEGDSDSDGPEGLP